MCTVEVIKLKIYRNKNGQNSANYPTKLKRREQSEAIIANKRCLPMRSNTKKRAITLKFRLDYMHAHEQKMEKHHKMNHSIFFFKKSIYCMRYAEPIGFHPKNSPNSEIMQ